MCSRMASYLYPRISEVVPWICPLYSRRRSRPWALSRGRRLCGLQTSTPVCMASSGGEVLPEGEASSLLTRPSWLPSKGTPPAPRGRGLDKGAAKLRKSCNCRNSRCLKLYCECFASGQYSFACNCQACHNNPENDEMRKRAIEQAPHPRLPRPPRLCHHASLMPARPPRTPTRLVPPPPQPAAGNR